MSESIDRRVVEMRFDNKDFEQNVNTTMTVLEKLKEKLSFKGAGEKFESTSGLGSAIDGVKNRFSALEVVGMTALVNLTNSAVNFGKQMAKSLTIDQVKAGFGEYELKMGSIQTIMAGTGESLDTVNQKLNELNEYSDKTIYSFSDMTQNIGKFTNAGVQLDDAVGAIKGVSNVAALSGANANEASRAMYNFSQALSAGYVKLIDWKSIENANMATKGFKQQLIDTAVAMGNLEQNSDGTYKVLTEGANGAYKESISATKNFNDSLSAAWMTTDVLTQTLNNYSIDLESMSESERQAWKDQLKSIGYTEEQIAQIEKLNAQAYASAQDVKTFSQLMDTVKESIGSGWAQTFEYIFGNFEDAKKLWTGVNNVISGLVSASADARNELLKGWNESPRGRDAMITGFQNLYKAVSAIVEPIHEAFRNVFPPTTVDQLLNFSTRFRALTSHMIIGEKTAIRLRSVFRLVFTVLKSGISIISNLAKIALNIGKIAIPIGDAILGVLARISSSILRITQTTDSNSGITSWFGDLAEVSDVASEKIGNLANGAISKLGSILSKVGPAIGKLFSLIGTGLSKLNLAKIGGLLAGGGIMAAALKIGKVADTVKEKLEGLFGKDGEKKGGLKEKIADALDGLSDTLNQFQASLKVGQLVAIAISLGILAAACTTLADIPAKKLATSVAAIGGLFTELGVASHLMNGAETKGLIKMAAAVLILTKAVQQLSDIPNIGQGLLAVGAILGELTAFCLIFDRLKIRPRSLAKTGEGLILMAVAINMLAKPVKELGAIDSGQLIQGLAAVAAMLSGFTLTALAFSKIKTKGLLKAGTAMVIMATAMRMLVKPLTQLGAMDLGSLAKGLGAMGTALLELAGFTFVMGKIAASTGNIMKASAALLIMSVGIKIMASAISQMGVDAGAGQGLSVMFGSLLILAGAMALMQNSIGGAAAMIVVAGALMIMAPAIALLSSLNLTGVVVGLVALAGTLLIFGGLSALLAPMIPIMMGLAAAMALLGVGVLSLGAGMTLLVGAFAMATGPITEGARALAEVFPIVAKGIGEGIVAIFKAVGDSAEQIKTTIIQLGDALISALDELGPNLMQSGLRLLMKLLDGIRKNIGEIATIALQIVVNFVNAVSEGMPDVVDAGFNLMISFINGLADAVAENGTRITNAFLNLILSVVQALLGLAGDFTKPAQEAIESYRQSLADGGDEAADTATEVSNDVNTNLEVPDQYSNGYNASSGLNNGLRAMIPSLRATSNEIAAIFDDVIRMRNEINSPSKRLFKTGTYMMEGLINGVDSLTGDYRKKADNISTIMVSSANRSIDSLSAVMNRGLDFSSSWDNASNVSVSMRGVIDRNQELTKTVAKLSSSLDDMTETMNSRQMINNIQVDGAADPDLFADQLLRRFRLNARTT